MTKTHVKKLRFLHKKKHKKKHKKSTQKKHKKKQPGATVIADSRLQYCFLVMC